MVASTINYFWALPGLAGGALAGVIGVKVLLSTALVAAEPELFEPAAVASFESEAKQDDMADALMLVCFFRETYVL